MEYKEPINIGCSSNCKLKLERLKTDGYFSEMLDAYKFAIGLAIAEGGIVPRIDNLTTFYNVGSLDPDRKIYNVVNALRVEETEPVYKTVERLAEWGIAELYRQSEKGQIEFSKIFKKISLEVEKS